MKLDAIWIHAESAAVEAAMEEGKKPKFSVVAYNGGPLTVGAYDMPVVIDLQGLEQGRSVIANLHHKKDQLVGHVGSVENDGKTHVVQVKGTTWAYNTPKDEEEKKKKEKEAEEKKKKKGKKRRHSEQVFERLATNIT